MWQDAKVRRLPHAVCSYVLMHLIGKMVHKLAKEIMDFQVFHIMTKIWKMFNHGYIKGLLEYYITGPPNKINVECFYSQ